MASREFCVIPLLARESDPTESWDSDEGLSTGQERS